MCLFGGGPQRPASTTGAGPVRPESAAVRIVFSPLPTRIDCMAKPHFVWIGSGRSKRRKVEGPAHWLDEASRARLPVPPGAILLDEFYRFCHDHNLVDFSGRSLYITDAELLHNTLFHSIHLPRFDRPVVLRPTQAGTTLPGASDYVTFDSADPGAFATALAKAWTEGSQQSTARRDVYLLEQLPAVSTGRALSASMAESDAVWVDPATPDSPPVTLPRLGRWQRPGDDLPPNLGRLQQLLRGLRRTLDSDGWNISWADDGAICWLTGICAQSSEPASQPLPQDGPT